MPTFTIHGDRFLLDGKPFRVLAGAIHYFRVVPEYWPDRLAKLKHFGLNTVETYIPWNAHGPRPGEFCFEGMLGVERFIELAAEMGLRVILRPSPYICSEWELGGLPSWLLADPQMRLRCSYRPYLDAVDRYYDELMPRLAPLQITRGGPVIAMQIENEYGSYGNDKAYLRHLEQAMRARGIDVLLFTSDGPSEAMFEGGTLPDVLATANFGEYPEGNLAKLRRRQPTGPLMCGEFWVGGGVNHWDQEYVVWDAQGAAEALDAVLAAGASLNFYMFHGGTNFGFMNGANHEGGLYKPIMTSYDWGSPLDEAGDPTPKYDACREVLGKHFALPDQPPLQPGPKRAYGGIALAERVALFDSLPLLSKPVESPTPLTFESVGLDYGFMLYRTMVRGPRGSCPLVIQEVHDRAQVFVDGAPRGVIYRNDAESPVALEFGPGEHQLDLLVENMGRINYGPMLHDRKGITEGVRLAGQFLYHWTIFPLRLDDLSRLRFGPAATAPGPFFSRGKFIVDDPADTFLSLPGWTKGVCWLNGFNLGRYWEIGPQRALYVPAPLLRKGENELIVLELHEAHHPSVEFIDHAMLGSPSP